MEGGSERGLEIVDGWGRKRGRKRSNYWRQTEGGREALNGRREKPRVRSGEWKKEGCERKEGGGEEGKGRSKVGVKRQGQKEGGTA